MAQSEVRLVFTAGKRTEGWLRWDSKDPRKFQVYFGDTNMEKVVKTFLRKKRTFRIPQSNKLDDFRKERALPTKSDGHFTAALTEMFGETGVYVDWI